MLQQIAAAYFRVTQSCLPQKNRGQLPIDESKNKDSQAILRVHAGG